MAGGFPYRRDTSINPYAFPITGPNDALSPITINKQELADKGIETFRIINPARCWVWLRGLSAADMVGATYNDIVMKGHLFPPGGVEIMRTQYPDRIAVVAANMPDVPVLDGSGVFLYPNRSVYLIYGGGL